MFNLDIAITEWRRQMAAGGVDDPEVLNELESHLHAGLEQAVSAGMDLREAFSSSVARLGGADLLSGEFDKIGGAKARRNRVGRAFLTLAGITNSYLESNMNASNSLPNTEPRWATYLKAAVFVAPAICLWTFSVIFLVPKLKQICKEAGMALPSVYAITAFIADNLPLIGGAVILLIALLEWRSSRWPRFRRPFVGGAVFLVNASVLVLITLMVVLALLAAPALMHRAQ